jgi:hypothetical protein
MNKVHDMIKFDDDAHLNFQCGHYSYLRWTGFDKLYHIKCSQWRAEWCYYGEDEPTMYDPQFCEKNQMVISLKKSIPKLKAQCKMNGIKGYSRKNKKELVRMLMSI